MFICWMSSSQCQINDDYKQEAFNILSVTQPILAVSDQTLSNAYRGTGKP